MKGEELDKALDEWLDRAAAEYGAAETRPGFEARVIANVNRRLEKRQWGFRRLSLAIAATAVIFVACYVFLARVQEHPATETALDKPQKPKSALLDGAPRKQAPSTMQAAASIKKNAARPAPPNARENSGRYFLSTGLSDQERYLISFVQTVSAQTSTDVFESGFGQLQMPDFEIPAFQIPKAQISLIMIDMVDLPMTLQREDQL
jgi:hypothetical protein